VTKSADIDLLSESFTFSASEKVWDLSITVLIFLLASLGFARCVESPGSYRKKSDSHCHLLSSGYTHQFDTVPLVMMIKMQLFL